MHTSQWAFCPQHNCCELISLLVCTWLLALNSGQKIGVYLSDISAAFDRVDVNLLLQKCRRAGVGDAFCDLLNKFFAPRKAEILVGGKKSRPREIANQVFQGTVLGPPMWNVFFADAAGTHGFTDARFADDLTLFKLFLHNIPSHFVMNE